MSGAIRLGSLLSGNWIKSIPTPASKCPAAEPSFLENEIAANRMPIGANFNEGVVQACYPSSREKIAGESLNNAPVAQIAHDHKAWMEP